MKSVWECQEVTDLINVPAKYYPKSDCFTVEEKDCVFW